jgi:N,N-dimethylformamidase
VTTATGLSKPPRTIVGYCWPWTVRPGEKLDFRVSADGGGEYEAALVRIICGDDMSSPDMFKELLLEAPFTGRYPARFQHTDLGSFVEIPLKPALNGLGNFSLQAAVYPTLLPQGDRPRAGGIVNSYDEPVFQDQHLVSRWDACTRRGWALLIDEKGRLVFQTGDGQRVDRTVMNRPLVQDRWFRVAASYDAAAMRVRIDAHSAAHEPGNQAAWPASQVESHNTVQINCDPTAPLRFGACTDGSGNGGRLKQAMCFSGRLDRVRLVYGVLDGREHEALYDSDIPDALRGQLIGFWDFSKGIDGIEITDLSANGLHGTTVNMPMRGVAGVDWDATASNWRERPGHYSAIHFHDDDLYDAEWEPDFGFTIPSDLRSGIYAIRLRHRGSEDYTPFFVAPPKGVTRAAIALLIPTATYTAYTNITGLTTLRRKKSVADEGGTVHLIEEDLHPGILQNADHADFTLRHYRRLGKGIYSNHTDGTLAGCASQRHPNMTMKPKGIGWTLIADTYIADWLEQVGIPFDVITDDLLHTEGVSLLERYTVVITGNHPEYYSRAMFDAVEAYQQHGGRWMYLGGNGFYWVTSFPAELPGSIEVRKDFYSGGWKSYELQHSSERICGGEWQKNGRSANGLVGVLYEAERGYAMEGSAPYRRLKGSFDPRAAFIFEGVRNTLIGDYGHLGGGAAGYEIDTISSEKGTPSHALHLAQAKDFRKSGSMLAPEYSVNGPQPVADMVFFETPDGGAVFSVGSMAWPGALSHNAYDNDVARITANVLRRFSDETPFRFDASS